MWNKTYTGSHTREISFPVGGIGTGSIGIGGDGRFREWEIRNRPDKGHMNEQSHIAVKAERDGECLDARMLCGDLQSSLMGEITDRMSRGYGFGPYRETLSGMPHFESCSVTAAYPFAEYRYAGSVFPGDVSMRVFNPFIPLNADDSSIPAAFFDIVFHNTQLETISYTAAFSLTSFFTQENGEIGYYGDETGSYLTLVNKKVSGDDTGYGEMCLATGNRDVSYQQYWYRGRYRDCLRVFWRDFTEGKLKNRVYHEIVPGAHANINDTCTLAVTVKLAPDEEKHIRFTLAWYFPNCDYYPDPDRKRQDGTRQWRNYYAVLYQGAFAVAQSVLRRWDELEKKTRGFTDAFYSQTLPEEVFDAISGNIAILKSPTVMRLEDGSFYGWEGEHCRAGCCEGSCTHVWNYAYALPFLFPALERSMRNLDYEYNQDAAGGMHFRLQLPLGAPQWDFRPCCDGQFGGVIKTYRDWKICGDNEWMKALWPKVKKSLEYAWSEENPDQWDRDRDGVLEGRQHQTLDMELFGPNSWLTSMYLCALKAACEMGRFLGDPDAAEYLKMAESGSAFVDRELFNGEYYQQKIDLSDLSILEKFNTGPATKGGGTAVEAYWNAEEREIKYQMGEGCAADQQLGQWHALLCGLGDILERDHSRSALKAVYRYNYKPSLRNHINPDRIYATGDEAATVICEWPRHKRKPVIAARYSEECWPGIEYQVASHMLGTGLYDEGMTVVRAVRNRFNGENRNPWNEFEAGSCYARSMSSYALLLALSGFEYDMTRGMIGFLPKDALKHRRYFWSVDSAFGLFEQDENQSKLHVLYGGIDLNHYRIGRSVSFVLLNDRKCAFTQREGTIDFAMPLRLRERDILTACNE